MTHRQKVRQSHLPPGMFWIFFGLLLLMSGVHQGLVILIDTLGWGARYPVLATAIPLCYWALVSALLTAYTRQRVRQAYELPLKEFAAATAKVAQGDFSVYVAPLHGPDGLDYLDVMIQDFNRMVEELGSIETLKTDFFSSVSHEIKTPLAAIQGNAELLARDGRDEARRQEHIRNILQATRRLNDLITNMLKLNKLEKQAIRPAPERYDLCAQLCECALQFERVWEEKDITFSADMEDYAPVLADRALLELVWTNLLSNAIKFTAPGGAVTLEQRHEGEALVVSVRDTGCGMDEGTMRRIFEKFYQGDTSHATEGNGLGLALVQRILELSDGSICVSSRVGEGSVFTVRLPAAPPEPTEGEGER
ncbi:MAG: HAMP domain-containing histidine kinase [Oscillospiraceae bacterium]|nr:HAMP domain-containing histidine kinase [Oscillospiraceae bacterium]